MKGRYGRRGGKAVTFYVRHQRMRHMWIQMRRWLVQTRFARTRVYLIQPREGHFLNGGKSVSVGPGELSSWAKHPLGNTVEGGLKTSLARTHKRAFRKWPLVKTAICKYARTNPPSPQYRPLFLSTSGPRGDLPSPSPMGQARCRKKGERYYTPDTRFLWELRDRSTSEATFSRDRPFRT